MWECPAGEWRARLRRACLPMGSGSQTARDLTSGGDQVEHFLATLGPGIELVGLVAVAPRPARALLVPGKPLGAPQIEIRLDQVGAKAQRLAEERLGVFVHFALEVHQSKI